jgi:hypothetical protein
MFFDTDTDADPIRGSVQLDYGSGSCQQKISFLASIILLITVSYRRDIYNTFSNHNIVEKPAEPLRIASASYSFSWSA